MSLFPAYANNSSDDNSKNLRLTSSGDKEQDTTWLNNPSFTALSNDKKSESANEAGHNKQTTKTLDHGSSRSDSDISSSCEMDTTRKLSSSHRKRQKKEKKRKKKKRKKEKEIKEKLKYGRNATKFSESLTEVDGLFYTDKKREPGNLQVPTLYRPAVPLYHRPKLKLISENIKYTRKENKSKKFRYYTFTYDKLDESDLKGSLGGFGEEPGTSTKEIGINFENEITEKTRQFNERLEKEPNNIKLWLEYVKFQDIACKVGQKRTAIKGSTAVKNLAEKKIAIIEKALLLNPFCEELLNEKFSLAEATYPPGKLMTEAMELINKDKTNLTLWRTVIRCSQFNLSRCVAPGVVIAFGNALESLHQVRMRHLSNKFSDTTKEISKIMLVLLLECGLFMRQAGLWEQLLLLFKQYLEMNVSNFVDESHESYKFNVIIDDAPIRNSEETILQCNLPLSAIWLRIERLREACHWLPLSDENELDCNKDADPQRFVFTEDIRNLIQPILPSTLNLQLIVTTMFLLKVPLLPSRHISFDLLRLNEIPYCFDDIEKVLASFYPVGLVKIENDKHFLNGMIDLISGPQYLKDKHGKTEFLTLIINMFESSGKQLQPAEAVASYSWCIRFHRFLICVSRQEDNITYNTSDAAKKKFKKFAKDKLKETQFRNELQLYNEYALLERDMCNDEGALNVLLTATKLRRFTYEKASYVALYRNSVETLLRSNPLENRKKAVDILCDLVSSDNIVTAKEKFKHVNVESTMPILRSSEEMSKDVEFIDVMSSHWSIEWIACHSYFLMLTESVWAASGLVQEFIDILITSITNTSSCSVGKFICEGLYEILVSVIHFHTNQTNTSFHVLNDVLNSAHKLFSNNIYFLHTISLIETSAGSAGSPWWKLSTFFTSTQSVLPRLFLIFILRHRVSKSLSESGWTDTSGHNLMSSLFSNLVNDNITRRCPLIWRMYLQFLSISKLNCDIKTAFYRAVEECPWVKALYVDAIQLLPENIQEIQDLLIEKELRLHSVMDELDILRSDTVETIQS